MNKWIDSVNNIPTENAALYPLSAASSLADSRVLHLWLARLRECLSDASVMTASPRLRFCASQDAVIFAAMILAEIDGADLDCRDCATALTYLRSPPITCPGLAAHITFLGRFDREDYDTNWWHIDAVRALKAARRITTALRWQLIAAERSSSG